MLHKLSKQMYVKQEHGIYSILSINDQIINLMLKI